MLIDSNCDGNKDLNNFLKLSISVKLFSSIYYLVFHIYNTRICTRKDLKCNT